MSQFLVKWFLICETLLYITLEEQKTTTTIIEAEFDPNGMVKNS